MQKPWKKSNVSANQKPWKKSNLFEFFGMKVTRNPFLSYCTASSPPQAENFVILRSKHAIFLQKSSSLKDFYDLPDSFFVKKKQISWKKSNLMKTVKKIKKTREKKRKSEIFLIFFYFFSREKILKKTLVASEYGI